MHIITHFFPIFGKFPEAVIIENRKEEGDVEVEVHEKQ